MGWRELLTGPRSGLVKGAAVTAVVALLAGVAVTSNGFDVAQTPVNDSSIWALQSGDGNRYGRINTDLAELDTIKTVRNPSGLVQTPSGVLLFAQNNEKVVDVSPAAPRDFGDDSSEYESTPAGSRVVVASDTHIAYLTASGGVYTATIENGATGTVTAIDPYAADEVAEGEERRVYRSDAIAITDAGVLYSYSSATGEVARFDVNTARMLGADPVSAGPEGAGVQLTVVGESWTLSTKAGDTLWLPGREPIDTGLTESALLQKPTAAGEAVFIADDTGLVSFALADGERQRLAGQDGTLLGIPAVPTLSGGDLFAAWLPVDGTAGTLWSSTAGIRELDFGDGSPSVDPVPVFQRAGARMILNDTQNGWVWTLPDGQLVPSSQDWGLTTQEEETVQAEVEEATEVVDPKPPIAEPDTFGVRAGQLVLLPVLLNDHDPNKDVLTILESQVAGLPTEFGTATVTEQSQMIAVHVAADATGTASFRYAVTDGTRDDGLNSAPAEVTLTVQPDNVNTAPVWCGVDGCLHEWPSPEVAPGATVTFPVLPGWVDPESDPLFVESVKLRGGVGTVSTTPEGLVVYQHPDAQGPAATVPIAVRVSDVRGASTEKILTIHVTPTPRLQVTPFAQVTTVGERVTVDPAAHIQGATGAVRLTSATVPTGMDAATVVINQGATFDFSATRPGNYPVSFTIADEAGETVSLARVTVLPADSGQLTTSPVTVFVRPRVDTSVNVFTAVSNPSGRVLLLSEALAQPATGATLDVDVVGQNLLRVRGTTATEQPGKLGEVHYVVSDGTGEQAHSARGIATVYLLPPSVPLPPIAQDDAITVRAGAQVDIPVLGNDVAPDGNVIVLNPKSVVNPSGSGLAFASGSSVRYLAGTEPGTFSLRYSVYVQGAPELTDTATVTIEVLPDGENRAPQPSTLTGRVIAGETIRIPFDSFGVDPDGDSVVLDRVLDQPKSGTASISSTGTAITYRSVKGFKGAVEFEYRVRDSGGETGTARVRIGVLDAQSDPSPITFSDYVEVQAGVDNKVVVRPQANDIDPSGGPLRLTRVSPDARAGTDEHAKLAARIGPVTDDQVTLAAGKEPGLSTFTYEVTSDTGDTGIGLIVVKAVRASVPDFPVVTDTRLSLDDRAQFPAGIDVVTGKVSWASGDVSTLKLSLWDETADAAVSGWTISGRAPDGGLLLPFALTGTNFQGDEVTTYGFLRIPAKKDIILALKEGDITQKVKENERVSFDLADLISVPAGEQLELDAQAITTAGQRTDAQCVVESGTIATYIAGAGAPWTDSCTVPARILGQEAFTFLAVPIAVEPPEPQPELRPGSLTVSPAAGPTTYDLGRMVTWEGEADPAALSFATDFDGDQFTVSQDGASLTVEAGDTASPGRENTVTVSLPSHPDTPAGLLTLKVGPAPSELPKGGTVSRECSQATGSSCVIEVIGAPGEVNLYESTPLVLAGVQADSTCPGVSFRVADSRSVTASWTAGTPGGQCQSSFQVTDAQGRVSAGERNGQVTLDLQSFPAAPDSVQQVGYGDGTVTLSVNAGQAANAYPALTGFTLTRDGASVGSCDAHGTCDVISGLTNGDKGRYEARAVNSVGQSADARSTTAWSYALPGMGAVTAKPVFTRDVTTGSIGAVEVAIENTDRSTRAYLVNDREYRAESGRSTVVQLSLEVGDQSVSVLPMSAHEKPPLAGPDAQARVTGVTVAGAPTVTVGEMRATNDSITLTAEGSANYSSRAPETVYIAYRGARPSCRVDSSGGNLTTTAANASRSGTITGLDNFSTYSVLVCYTNGFGLAQADAGEILTWDKAQVAVPTGLQYQIATNGEKHTVVPVTVKKRDLPRGFFFDSGYDDVWGADINYRGRYCLNDYPDRCGDWAEVSPADPSRAWQVQVTGRTVVCPAPGSPLLLSMTGDGLDSANRTVSKFWAKHLVPVVEPEPNPSPGPDPQPEPEPEYEWREYIGATVPADALAVREVTWAYDWSGSPQTSGFEGRTGTTDQNEIPCG